MSMETLKQFEKQQYLNLETVRKNGLAVNTPVWFAQDGDLLFVWTQTGAGKAKRIRNNGSVRIAPSTASGEPVGDWMPAKAQTNESPEAIRHVEKLMQKKYGVMFYVVGLLGRLRGGAKYTAIKIQI